MICKSKRCVRNYGSLSHNEKNVNPLCAGPNESVNEWRTNKFMAELIKLILPVLCKSVSIKCTNLISFYALYFHFLSLSFSLCFSLSLCLTPTQTLLLLSPLFICLTRHPCLSHYLLLCLSVSFFLSVYFTLPHTHTVVFVYSFPSWQITEITSHVRTYFWVTI